MTFVSSTVCDRPKMNDIALEDSAEKDNFEGSTMRKQFLKSHHGQNFKVPTRDI